LKLQSMLCAWTRSHVWHMKVLLYAVFNVRGLRESPAAPEISEPSKLNSAVPTNASRGDRLAGDPRARAAQPMLKNIGLVVLIRTLAEMAGRTPNFEHRLWST